MYHRCCGRIYSWTTGSRISITSFTHRRIGFITTARTTSTSSYIAPQSFVPSSTASSLQQRRAMSLSAGSTATTTTASPSFDHTSTNQSTAFTPNNSRRVIVHWFRDNDLRLHDNPALIHSTSLLATTLSSSSSTVVKNPPPPPHDVILPIYIFDTTRLYGNHCTTHFSTTNDPPPQQDPPTIKCGPRRAQFLLESVTDLRQQLQLQCQSQLLVACGHPATILSHLIAYIQERYTNNIRIVCQQEVASEETKVAKEVRQVLRKLFPKSNDKLLHEVWGSTMYDLHDLPFDRTDLYHMPNGFTPFREQVEKKCTMHKPFAVPKYLPFFLKDEEWPTEWTIPNHNSTTTSSLNHVVSTTFMPTLLDLGYTDAQVLETQQHDPRGFGALFVGGETAGLARVHDYIWGSKDLLPHYFDTRNGMIGADYSTKFSPWLAHGCISPRQIVLECRKYEATRIKNKSTYWVVFELLWRDFCKFFVLKHETKIFYPHGIVSNSKDGEKRKWNTYGPALEAWKEGRTGYPLVDANMREMKATGFMSNRGRQNVASFLALDLQWDWRHGGDWFESNLIDYDVYSNWVNWCAAAGLTGGRINRFNIVKQSRDYDQHGEYIHLWIPELRNVPVPYVHEPWKMTQFQQVEYNCRLGVDYPNPIIPPFAYNASGQPGSGRSGGPPSRGNHPHNNREKQRKPNHNQRNRHQKYEMKGLNKGSYNFDE